MSLHLPILAGLRTRSVLPVAALALAVLLAACGGVAGQPAGGGGDGGGTGASGDAVQPGSTDTGSGATAAPEASASQAADFIDHPTGAADIVLRVGEEGGFMMMEAVMSRMPAFTLYGDGRVVTATVPQAKSQAGINGAPQQVLHETRLTEDQVQSLLRYALFDGMLGVSKEEFPILVMDVPTTVIELHAGGIDKVVKVAGLGMDPQPGPDAVVLKALAGLVANLQSVVATDDYVATQSIAIIAETQPDPAAGVPAPWPWTDLAPGAFHAPAANDPFGFTSHLLSDAQAQAIGIANGGSAPATTWQSGTKSYVVVVRPALPDEAAKG